MSLQNKGQNICVKYLKLITMKKLGALRQAAMSMFAVGTRLDGSLRQRRLKGDGSVSSIIVATTLIGITFSYFWESQNPYSWYLRNGYPKVLLVIYVLTLFSIASLVSLLLIVKYKPSEYMDAVAIRDPVSKMLNVFLFLFAIGIVVYEVINIIIDLQCYFEVFHLQDSEQYLLSSFGRVAEATFAFLQFVVIAKLSDKRLRRKIATYYLISTIILTNVSMWFFTLFRLMYGYTSKIPADLNVRATEIEMCYWNSSIRSDILQPMNGILIPVQQEYSLLCICILATMFPSYNFLRQTHPKRVSYDDKKTEFTFGSCPLPTKKRILIYVFSVLIFLPATIVSFMREFKDTTFLQIEWEYCATMPVFVLICLIFRGFHLIKTEMGSINDSRITGNILNNDILFLVSSCGQFANDVTLIIYSVHTGAPNFRIIKSVLLILQVFYQTVFIMILKRLPSSQYRRVYGVLLTLVIGNLILWAFNEVQAFMISTSDDDIVGFRKEWPTARQAIFSLVCFYRFQSFVSLYRFCKL